MKIDIEHLLNKRWAGITHAILIIMSFGLPWVFPEDYGNTTSLYGLNLTTGSELNTFGDFTGFLLTGTIIVMAAIYMWQRCNNRVAVRTASTMFIIMILFPILAGGSIERVWLGYITTLLLCAPTPTLMFVNWAHRKLEPSGGLKTFSAKLYGKISARLSRPAGQQP